MTSEEYKKDAKTLRNLIIKRGGSTDGVIAFLAAEKERKGMGSVARLVNHGNINRKTAMHFAAQRCDTAAEVLKVLVAYGGDINAITIRGHTPLLYAAGRGRSKAVLFLLGLRAKCCVMTVTGDTVSGMATGRLDDKLCAKLVEVETAELVENIRRLDSAKQKSNMQLATETDNLLSSARGFLDYRTKDSAVKAQIQHAQNCKGCRVGGQWQKHFKIYRRYRSQLL
jgi:ankyrin repeat protein